MGFFGPNFNRMKQQKDYTSLLELVKGGNIDHRHRAAKVLVELGAKSKDRRLFQALLSEFRKGSVGVKNLLAWVLGVIARKGNAVELEGHGVIPALIEGFRASSDYQEYVLSLGAMSEIYAAGQQARVLRTLKGYLREEDDLLRVLMDQVMLGENPDTVRFLHPESTVDLIKESKNVRELLGKLETRQTQSSGPRMSSEKIPKKKKDEDALAALRGSVRGDTSGGSGRDNNDRVKGVSLRSLSTPSTTSSSHSSTASSRKAQGGSKLRCPDCGKTVQKDWMLCRFCMTDLSRRH